MHKKYLDEYSIVLLVNQNHLKSQLKTICITPDEICQRKVENVIHCKHIIYLVIEQIGKTWLICAIPGVQN